MHNKKDATENKFPTKYITNSIYLGGIHILLEIYFL